MIIRSKHNKSNPYLSISMKLLRDRRLTSEERDCLIMMLSNVDDWEFSYKGLAMQLGLKRETVKARVQSLIEKGYVSVSYPLGDNGKPLPFAKGVWEIREEPIISDRGIKKQDQQCPILGHQKTGTIVSDSWTPDAGHQALDTKLWTPESGHQVLDTSERTQRNSINVESPNENYQDKEYQVEEYQSSSSSTSAEEEEEEKTLPPYNPSSFTESSSVANAPSPASKNSSQSAVISQKEYLYQQFLKKYPKKPYGRDMAATKQAFFDVVDSEESFAEIMAGVDAWCNSGDWKKEGGQYITRPVDFLSTHKWEEIPRTINTEIDPGFIEYLNSAKRAEELGL